MLNIHAMECYSVSKKEGHFETCYNMDKSGGCMLSENKAVIHTLYHFTTYLNIETLDT